MTGTMTPNPVEIYAQVILHTGCAIPPINEFESRLHKWHECRSRNWYLKLAQKHQHKLNSNGLAIGFWIKTEDLLQIKNQKGDYLGLLDLLLAPLSQ